MASDAGSKANQATAKVRLSLVSDAVAPIAARCAVTGDAAGARSKRARHLRPRRPPATPGKRVALVIGNGAYAHVKALPNPANDARASRGACATSALPCRKASISTAQRCRR